MKIKKIIINSFRGIENVEFELDKKLNIFKGANKLGKSTIIDSAMWVLCGETLVNGVQDQDNRNQNNLKNELNVILEMENGIILERKYKDIWKEDEYGELKYVRTQNDFFVNGAKYKKGEYFEYIKDAIGLNKRLKVDKFKLLRCIMDYNYFCNEETQISRNFITKDLLGLATDEEILNDKRFESIKVDMQLQKYADGKCINKYQTEIKQINNDIVDKKALIENAKNNIDEEKLSKYQELVDERTSLIVDDIRSNSEYLAYNERLNEISINIQEEQKNQLKTKFELENEKQTLIGKGNKYNYSIQEKKQIINVKNNEIKQNNSLIEKLNEEINFFSNNSGKIICPHCNKVANEKQVEENENKNKQIIKNAQIKIKDLNDNNSKLQEEIRTLENEISNLENQKKECADEYYSCIEKLNKINSEIESNLKVKELLLESEEVKSNLNKFINDYNTKKSERINELNVEINYLENMKNDVIRIQTMTEILNNLKIKKVNLENKIILVKDFKDLRSKIIKENISKVFPNVEIEIIEESDKTGCTEEVCYAKLKGVEYKAINDGHRYLVGIMIIEDIKKALGIEDLPLIFDKFADIDKNTLKQIQSITNAQIITTLVSDDNKIKLINE